MKSVILRDPPPPVSELNTPPWPFNGSMGVTTIITQIRLSRGIKGGQNVCEMKTHGHKSLGMITIHLRDYSGNIPV